MLHIGSLLTLHQLHLDAEIEWRTAGERLLLPTLFIPARGEAA